MHALRFSWLDRILVAIISRLEFDGVSNEAVCAALTKIPEQHWAHFPNECMGRIIQHAWAATMWAELSILAGLCFVAVCSAGCCVANVFSGCRRNRRCDLDAHQMSPGMRATMYAAMAQYRDRKLAHRS